ncbi:hypothetical protein HPB51_028980 [Rhipicephalus microplus]|uniref:BZIP domain-containing protein n=1 Tax=Rhipicephalus microplus TaxID=6941 RepID=A0A9J6CVF6_RHIMP|nr:hypothetical protein HPB51_028980 [Rhipicephalus microplus]
MYHRAQQMEESLSRRGELSSRQRSMILDLDNAGPSQNMREQAHTSSPLPSPDPNMPLLTTPEFEELLLDFSAPETPPMPTTLFQLTEEEEQRCTRLIDGLPEPNLPRQQRTQRQPHPVLQQHVTVGANESDSSSPVSNCSFSLPSSPELMVLKDYVKDNAQTVPTLGLAPPSRYMHSDENRTRESSAQQMTMHATLHQQPRGEEFGSREWIATLNMDNAGRYRHISVQAHCSSLQAFTDMKMLQMTSPEREEIKKGFYVPESPPKPSTRLSRTGQVQQYPRCCIDVLPGAQLQQQLQIPEQPSAVFQQLVTEGPNVSDSSASTSNHSSNLPTWSEHSAMGDHVKDHSQMVPTLGNSPPLCYTISDEDSSNGDVAQQTTMHQELPRWEESRLSMRVMSVELNNTGSHQYSSEQARGMRSVSRPRAKPPLSPTYSSDEKSAKLDAKRWRNRIAQAKCRQRRIDLDTFLEQKLRNLKLETDTMAAAVNRERYQVELLRQRWAMHAKFCDVT